MYFPYLFAMFYVAMPLPLTIDVLYDRFTYDSA